MRYLLGWMEEEEEDEEELQSEALLCHPLCQCDACSPAQKVCWPRTPSLAVSRFNQPIAWLT